MALTRILTFFAEGDFLTRSRVRLWSGAVLVASVIAIAFLAFTARGLNDYTGRPLGTDFSDVYAAGQLAHDGQGFAAYDPARHYREEQAIFGKETPFYGWHYPPFFLLAAQALAYLPYVPALLIWQVLTFAGYVIAMRTLIRSSPTRDLANDPLWLLLGVSFPAVFVNFTHGQNGFLTTALLAGGLALLDSRPIAAGILFGLMAYKPQFAILIPFALAAGRHWKCLTSATLTVFTLVVLATACLGQEIWAAFFASTHFSRAVILEQGATGFEKIQSVFAAIRLLGGSVWLGYAAQLVVALTAVVAICALWRSHTSGALKGAGLCLGVLLSTPYCLDYDLMLLAPVIALCASEGRARGFQRWELLLLSCLWLVPFVARVFAHATHLALVPSLMMIALAFVVKRALA